MLSRDFLALFPQKDRSWVGILCSINAILLVVQRKAGYFSRLLTVYLRINYVDIRIISVGIRISCIDIRLADLHHQKHS